MALTKTKYALVLALAAIGVVAITFAALTASDMFSNNGSISYPPPPPTLQIGVYTDSSCTTPVSNIAWGTLSPGSNATQTVYVENEGNVNATLNMTTSSWSSSTAQSDMSLTWNREGYQLNAGLNVSAVLTLSVSSSISGISTFSFNVTITGTQH